jgi:RNase P subunit RPR2
MWQCDNCGYTDEDGSTFEEEASETNPDEVVRYCPECGSDEVYAVEEEDDEDFEEDEEEEEEEEDEEEEDDEDWDEDFEEEDEEEW